MKTFQNIDSSFNLLKIVKTSCQGPDHLPLRYSEEKTFFN